MKRRLFVATPLLLAGTAPLARDAGNAPPAGATPRLARRAATAFGTTIQLTVLAPEGDTKLDHTEASLHRAMREVQRIDEVFSLFRADSQLSRLNREGRLDGADPHLLHNLAYALQLGEASGGAFDLTVQPLWELFARAKAEGGLPTAAAIRAARALVDHRAVRLVGDSVRIDRRGARITLNSLAQGYAVDVVLASLRRAGIGAALIDTGELGSVGRKPDRSRWTVGVQHPRLAGECIAPIAMDGRVLSTSGDYATHFSLDFRHHHIFDPATGMSPPQWSSTVVMAASGMVADGLSTALMVLDRERGARLLAATPGADALWIDKQARCAHTGGLPLLT